MTRTTPPPRYYRPYIPGPQMGASRNGHRPDSPRLRDAVLIFLVPWWLFGLAVTCVAVGLSIGVRAALHALASREVG